MAGRCRVTSNKALDQLRDRLLEAPDDVDAVHLPPRFGEARQALVRVIDRLQRKGVPNDTLVTVMLAEMLPRMVHGNGPEWAAATLGKIAQSLIAGASPVDKRQ